MKFCNIILTAQNRFGDFSSRVISPRDN